MSEKEKSLEIICPRRREKARKAMLELWDALDLTRGYPVQLPNDVEPKVKEIHYELYFNFGKAILGEACPEKEVMT